MRDYRYPLYLSRAGDDDTQTAFAGFRSTSGARKFVDALLAGDPWLWSDDAADSAHGAADPGTTIVGEGGVVVSTLFYPDAMREVMTYELTLRDIARDMDPLVLRKARWFRAGPNLPRELGADYVSPADRKRSVARSSRAGLVPIADLALAAGVTPRDARAALRRAGEPKPAAGWAWSSGDADRIRKIIAG